MESHDGIAGSLTEEKDDKRGLTRNETKGRFSKVKVPGNATLYGKDSEWKRRANRDYHEKEIQKQAAHTRFLEREKRRARRNQPRYTEL